MLRDWQRHSTSWASCLLTHVHTCTHILLGEEEKVRQGERYRQREIHISAIVHTWWARSPENRSSNLSFSGSQGNTDSWSILRSTDMNRYIPTLRKIMMLAGRHVVSPSHNHAHFLSLYRWTEYWKCYGGWNENGHHRLICLNTWLPVDGTGIAKY